MLFFACCFAQENDLHAIIRKLTCYPCLDTNSEDSKRGVRRCVIVTRGKDPVLLSCTGHPDILSIPVPDIPIHDVVDTNCAGDAFVGGFLGYYALHCNTTDVCGLESEGPINMDFLCRCVKEGNFYARQIIQVSGCDTAELRSLNH